MGEDCPVRADISINDDRQIPTLSQNPHPELVRSGSCRQKVFVTFNDNFYEILDVVLTIWIRDEKILLATLYSDVSL